jgi:hypothetical protein
MFFLTNDVEEIEPDDGIQNREQEMFFSLPVGTERLDFRSSNRTNPAGLDQ